MPVSIFFFTSLIPGVLLGFDCSSPSSRMAISAWRGSASSSTPPDVYCTTLFRILSSSTHPGPSPSNCTFSLYLFSKVARASRNPSSSPTATKSSPCTRIATPFVGWWNKHPLALPWMYPDFTRVSEYSVDQFRAASLVPYILITSSPTMFSSPFSRSSDGSTT